MESVQSQIVPCSSLYLFSRFIVASQMQNLSINCRILISCTCYYWGSSPPFFILVSLFVSIFRSNFCPDTGFGGGHLFRLGFSIALWRGRDTANKYRRHVWGIPVVDGPHWFCHSPR